MFWTLDVYKHSNARNVTGPKKKICNISYGGIYNEKDSWYLSGSNDDGFCIFYCNRWRFNRRILLMFVKDFFLEVAQKKGRTKRTHQIAGFEKMM